MHGILQYWGESPRNGKTDLSNMFTLLGSDDAPKSALAMNSDSTREPVKLEFLRLTLS